MTHVLIADRMISRGEIEQAIPSLENALKNEPRNPTVLNNLALALAKTNPQEIPRALELCTQAVSLAPQNAEYLDTLGEILSLAGDDYGAIANYENALQIDSTRSSTRQRLADLCRKLGLNDLAEVHERLLAKP